MATIRITSRGEYAVLIDEPHPCLLATFRTFVDATSFCLHKGLKIIVGW